MYTKRLLKRRRSCGAPLRRWRTPRSRALEELVRDGAITVDAARRFRGRYEHKRDHAEGHSQDEYDELDAELQLIAAERSALIDLRTRGEIDNTVLRQLQRTLDISEERANSHR